MYVAERDLVIPPDAEIGNCPPDVQLKPRAKLYKQPTGDTLIGEQGPRGEDVDADQVCISDPGSHTSATRRYGITGLTSGLVHYVAQRDLVILPEHGIRAVCPEYAQIRAGAKLYAQPDGDTGAPQPNQQFYSGAAIAPTMSASSKPRSTLLENAATGSTTSRARAWTDWSTSTSGTWRCHRRTHSVSALRGSRRRRSHGRTAGVLTCCTGHSRGAHV